ncbi:MAG TPA: Fic family protein, partial [Sorangium sp.]|nr:Fic family protein [Sorangium sp.]
SLAAAVAQPSYELAAIRWAVWVHAEIIRIHPFEDGNGRTCRALMNVILVRLGLPPSIIQRPKQEYIACLNLFYDTSDIVPLCDLCLQCIDGAVRPPAG